MIEPTVGRIVWYTPGHHDGMLRLGDQPFAAVVAYVHNARLVNLTVFDHYGNAYGRERVVLRQEEDERPHGVAFCEWMPYQIGQAKKHGATG